MSFLMYVRHTCTGGDDCLEKARKRIAELEAEVADARAEAAWWDDAQWLTMEYLNKAEAEVERLRKERA